ncbi:MAG TPA: hypothetical protein DDX71_05950 [Ruminococcus sp.]|nr:hypothetical protein [Ruminococcus sp.]
MANVTYRGRKIVRNGKTIYYGSMANPYVVSMNIADEKTENGFTTATKIQCYLMKTDKGLSPMESIQKNAVKPNLFEALELASAWLDSVRS